MYLGIDFGTSGCRACVIDTQQRIIAQVSQSLPEPQYHDARIEQQASVWLDGLSALFDQLKTRLDLTAIERLVIDGTSGTVLLCDPRGRPLTPALMYNDASSQAAVDTIRQSCPKQQHLTLTATSGLAKAIQLSQTLATTEFRVVNQADFLSNHLADNWGISDYHNTLKLGYNVQKLEWPDWISQLLPPGSLPHVLSPGQTLAVVSQKMADQYGLSTDCQVCGGTTDANAAFLATQSTHNGDAVTSLGSTLVLKILTDAYIEDIQCGIYCHRLGDRWLTGGASNAGARILKNYFTRQQLVELSRQIDTQHSLGLNYYPLLDVGERFPIFDPKKQPLISPRPSSDIQFLQALLEGLSEIEKTGYQKLAELGAPYPKKILTTCGGAINPQWTAIRNRVMGIPVSPAGQTEASYGSALLASKGLTTYLKSS